MQSINFWTDSREPRIFVEKCKEPSEIYITNSLFVKSRVNFKGWNLKKKNRTTLSLHYKFLNGENYGDFPELFLALRRPVQFAKPKSHFRIFTFNLVKTERPPLPTSSHPMGICHRRLPPWILDAYVSCNSLSSSFILLGRDGVRAREREREREGERWVYFLVRCTNIHVYAKPREDNTSVTEYFVTCISFPSKQVKWTRVQSMKNYTWTTLMLWGGRKGGREKAPTNIFYHASWVGSWDLTCYIKDIVFFCLRLFEKVASLVMLFSSGQIFIKNLFY